MNEHNAFLEELNMFRNEVETALKFLYTELAIHAIASKRKRVKISLNSSPTFWNTILNALQHSTFITLGRIFDIKSQHSIHVLRKLVEKNKEIFTKEAFKERWQKDSDRSKIDYRLPKYLETVYAPTNKDFRKFRKFIAKQQSIYENIYRPVRDHFGHRKYVKNEVIKSIFDKISVRELEKFCVRLKDIHEVLWQLYHNGRGPLFPIKQQMYSTQSIIKKKFEPNTVRPHNAQIIEEAVKALRLLALGNNQRIKHFNRINLMRTKKLRN